MSEAIKAVQAAGIDKAASRAKAEAAAGPGSWLKQDARPDLHARNRRCTGQRGQEFMARVKQKKGAAHA